MSNILAAFSILLAVFTFIQSLYRKEIEDSINMEVNKLHKRENKSNYIKVKKILINYQIPLFFVSFIISIIMAPVSIEILRNSIVLICKGNAKYDMSSTTVILLNIAFIIIFFKESYNLCQLVKKMKKLEYW